MIKYSGLFFFKIFLRKKNDLIKILTNKIRLNIYPLTNLILLFFLFSKIFIFLFFISFLKLFHSPKEFRMYVS